jgi:hypothetical protein
MARTLAVKEDLKVSFENVVTQDPDPHIKLFGNAGSRSIYHEYGSATLIQGKFLIMIEKVFLYVFFL